MTERATLEALLARVLEGTGPDEKIDGQLALLKGYTYEKHKGDKFAWWRRPNGWRIGTYGNENRPPPYTASLDAVLRDLLLKGWDWARWRCVDGVVVSLSADLPLTDQTWKSICLVEISTDHNRALIACCLKAMMETQGE